MKKMLVFMICFLSSCGNISAESIFDSNIYMIGSYSIERNFRSYYYKVGDLNVNHLPFPSISDAGWISSILKTKEKKLVIIGDYNGQPFVYKIGESSINLLSIFENLKVSNVKGIYCNEKELLYIYGQCYSSLSFPSNEALDLYNSTAPHSFYYVLGNLEPNTIPNKVNAVNMSLSDATIYNDYIYFCGSYNVINDNISYAFYYREGEENINMIPIPNNAIFICANAIAVYKEKIIIIGHYIDSNEKYIAYYYYLGDENITIIPKNNNISGNSGLAITVVGDHAYVLGDCMSNNIRMCYYYKIGDSNITIIPESENIYLNNAFNNSNDVYFAGNTWVDIPKLCYYKVGDNNINIIPPFRNIGQIQINDAKYIE